LKAAAVEGVRCLRILRRNSTLCGSSHSARSPLLFGHASADRERSRPGNGPFISLAHDPGMPIDQTVPTAAALAARDRVELAAHAAARDERGAAGLARSALFEEALLGALKARFAELRTVAK
jgi:hypothetical protein